MTQDRVPTDTRRRRFFWLLGLSLLLHVVFTPLAGLIGIFQLWLDRPEQRADGPTEQLREIPIELFEDSTPAEQPGALPEQDPVREIDQLVDLPVEGPVAPTAPPQASQPPKPKPPKSAPDKSLQSEHPADPPDGGAPSAPVASLAPTSAEAPSAPSAHSGAGEPAPSSSETAERPVADSRGAEDAPIDNPVALAGKSAKIIEKQTSVGLVLYMDRVRAHPLGKRIATLLPRLPQWDEFFGQGGVNPVADFDRMFLLGPSFADSSGLVMAIEYNTPQAKMRAAVDGLVKARGQWIDKTKVPTAITFADRAERVILFPAPKVVVVVPPHLKEQATQQGVFGVPKAKGPEAMVAFTVNPAKALRRFGLDLPSSLQTAKIRITPLPSGQVLLELEADDVSAEGAEKNAQLLTRQINATLDLVSGVSDLLGRFGFGGLAAGAELPRVELKADGKLVKGRQVLTPQQVTFILDRIERQLLRLRTAPRPSPPEPQPSSRGTRPAQAPTAK